MSNVDSSKRTWIITSACAGAVGAGAVAVPFVSTFSPSEKAKAAGAAVEVDISALKPGEKVVVEWRGKPVWIMRRTPEMLASLAKTEANLADPKSERKAAETTPMVETRNTHRSIKPEIFVAVGICSHLGCSPSDKLEAKAESLMPAGKAALFALATAQPSIWLAACIKTSPRPTTSKCRPTCT